jgi:methionine sulfoxide reductase heme-binding subunit
MNNVLTILFVQQKMNLRDMPGLITNTYMFAVMTAIFMIGIAILVASMIQFQSGANPKDRMKRKIWFWILAVLTPVIFFLYNLYLVLPNIKAGPAMNKFSLHNGLSPVIAFVLFVVFGIVVSKLFKRKKVGNWFNKVN